MVDYEFLDMIPLIRESNLRSEYYAGDQLELLHDAFDVTWIAEGQEGSYSGTYWCVFKYSEDEFGIFNGYFGSCSMCDELEGTNPMEWLRDSVKNVRIFSSFDDLIEWMMDTEDYSWQDIKSKVIQQLQRNGDKYTW